MEYHGAIDWKQSYFVHLRDYRAAFLQWRELSLGGRAATGSDQMSVQSRQAFDAFFRLKYANESSYLIFKIVETELIVEHEGVMNDFADVIELLPPKDVRYLLLGFPTVHLDSGNALAFCLWAPDLATVRMKMLYAAAKETVRRKLGHVQTEVQASDLSELTLEIVLHRLRVSMSVASI
eukprot:TRINITY_DN706_c0_g1_i1.p1 TRINITY_DN706_c0_g1~~TRINITY_DN706_c0_g1_i1.p1  ORF type:complete len:179 (+),score=40.10 TRINITY_DN706_c0_g1_i1:45-581(+)